MVSGLEGDETPIAVELQVLCDLLEGKGGGEGREEVLVKLREDARSLVLQAGRQEVVVLSAMLGIQFGLPLLLLSSWLLLG